MTDKKEDKQIINLDAKIIDKIIKEVAKEMGLVEELLCDKETYESLQNVVSLSVGLYMAELLQESPDTEDKKWTH